MVNCSVCEHAIFDAKWGEYKCEMKQTYVYKYGLLDCPDYKKGIPKASKENTEYEES